MSGLFYLGVAVTIGLIVAVSYLSGRRVKSAEAFSRGSAGVVLTTGCIGGTLIGGSTTIGTAQLAFTYGFSGWWFSLGCGISVLLMALFTSDRLRKRGILTISSLIGKEYGETAQTVNAILNSFGVSVNILAQILSGTSLMALLFPGTSLGLQALCMAGLMLLYSVFGGIKSVGASGTVKTLLIWPAMFACVFLALKEVGGISTLYSAFPKEQFFSLFARGVKTDGGAGMSTIMGVLTSQAYMSAVMTAKNDRVSKCSLLLCTAIVLPLGITSILVGLYMRYITPAEVLAVPELMQITAKTALPMFIQTHFSPFFSGIILSILLITVVGCGSSIALSVSTVIKKDIIDRLTPRFKDERKGLVLSRSLLTLILLTGALLTGIFNTNIADIGFLSLGFRAASTFAPLFFTLFFPGRVSSRYALIAIIAGVACALLLKFVGGSFDPATAGVALSMLIMLFGMLFGRRKSL